MINSEKMWLPYLALFGGDGVGNFGAEHSVVHHEDVQLGDIVDDEFLEVFLVLAAVLVGLLGTVPDRGHKGLAFEASADAGVNTLKIFKSNPKKTLGVTKLTFFEMVILVRYLPAYKILCMAAHSTRNG